MVTQKGNRRENWHCLKRASKGDAEVFKSFERWYWYKEITELLLSSYNQIKKIEITKHFILTKKMFIYWSHCNFVERLSNFSYNSWNWKSQKNIVTLKRLSEKNSHKEPCDFHWEKQFNPPGQNDRPGRTESPKIWYGESGLKYLNEVFLSFSTDETSIF